MKLAGYEATPAEEIPKTKQEMPEAPQDNKAANLPANDFDKQRIKTVAAELGMKKITGLDNLTKVEARRIYFRLMEKKAGGIKK